MNEVSPPAASPCGGRTHARRSASRGSRRRLERTDGATATHGTPTCRRGSSCRRSLRGMAEPSPRRRANPAIRTAFGSTGSAGLDARTCSLVGTWCSPTPASGSLDAGGAGRMGSAGTGSGTGWMGRSPGRTCASGNRMALWLLPDTTGTADSACQPEAHVHRPGCSGSRVGPWTGSSRRTRHLADRQHLGVLGVAPELGQRHRRWPRIG